MTISQKHVVDGILGVIGVGVDIIRISRVRKVFDEHGERFLRRVFFEDEISYIMKAPSKFYERIASTFSAKESVFKTIGMRRPIIFRDIQIIRTPQPSAILHGITKKTAEEKGIEKILLSITHDGDICITFAIAVGRR